MSDQVFRFRRRGLLLVVSAPSGGGKSVVLKRLIASDPDLSYSVSVTSRPPRGDEVEGQSYHFVTRERFEDMIREDQFYEWAEVHGNLYGTRADTIERALARGQDIALDIDVRGGHSVKFRCPEAVLVFLLPPSFQVLEQRLRGRETDTEQQIQLRLKNAREEMPYWKFYDYTVVNHDLDHTVEQVRQVLNAERCRSIRLQKQGEQEG
jgi:guanylate kinase